MLKSRDIAARIDQRLKETGKSAAQAAREGKIHPSTVTLARKNPGSRTLENLERLAKGLDTSLAWLLFGSGSDPGDENKICVDRDLLRRAVQFVLLQAGSPAEEAEVISDIFPAALEMPPIDVVGEDPFLSFQLHMRFQPRKAAAS